MLKVFLISSGVLPVPNLQLSATEHTCHLLFASVSVTFDHVGNRQTGQVQQRLDVEVVCSLER